MKPPEADALIEGLRLSDRRVSVLAAFGTRRSVVASMLRHRRAGSLDYPNQYCPNQPGDEDTGHNPGDRRQVVLATFLMIGRGRGAIAQAR